MKKLLIPALLLAAASSYGITSDMLTTASGDRAIDYGKWFAGFGASSDGTFTSAPYPDSGIAGLPAAFIDANREWGGWKANFGADPLGSPIEGTNNPLLVTKVEFAFLGETAGWWDHIGVRYNGDDMLLAKAIQTLNPNVNREFGDYWEWTLEAGETLDFFVIGTEKFGPNDTMNPTPIKGGQFFMYDEGANNPDSALAQSYYGTLQPLTNKRVVDINRELSDQAWTVMGFEDIQAGKGSDLDYNDILFAARAANLDRYAPVPEPSTYGLIGAAALLALAGYRRFKKV